MIEVSKLDLPWRAGDLEPETESLLDWARQKKQEDDRVKELCEKFPALKKARDNYDLILNIVKDEHEN